MVLYYHSFDKIISKIYSIIIIFHILYSIKTETAQESRISRIIYIGDFKFRYMNFASYSNGDMVIESTCYPENNKRMFYGLKRNGRPFFKDKSNNEMTPYYSIDVQTENFKKLEGVGTIIKLSSNENKGKEYYFSISKLECNAELFDFDNDKVYTKYVDSFTSLKTLRSLRNVIIPLSDSNSPYIYISGFSALASDNWQRFFLQKHIFSSLNDFSNINTYNGEAVQSTDSAYGYQISCFITNDKLIICFYLTTTNTQSYNIVKYENDFTNVKIFSIQANIDDDHDFYKCIQLKDKVGVYVYYLNKDNLFYPSFLFKEFDPSSQLFKDYLPSFELSKNNFLKNLLINDLIKLTESKIVFSSVIEGKEIVYIVLIDIFGDKKRKIRYYPLRLYEKHHYKVLFDLRLHNYNNFIALGLSLCPIDECSSDDNEHYSTLMILNYPNSTDETLYLDDYLYNNNNITIDNIEIDLKNYLNFENNIFGYVYLKTSIISITHCAEYKFYLSSDEEIEIKEDGNLEGDEKMKIKFKGPGDFYPLLPECQIEYILLATEPDLINYDTYPESKEGKNDSDFFERNNYTGRASYYNIKLTKELSHTCQDSNCDLCYKNENDYCITCRYNFKIFENNMNSFKQCLPPQTDFIATTEIINDETTEIVTQKQTEIETQKTTEFINDETTEIVTQKPTEIITQKQTEIVTQKTTEFINYETTEIITQKQTEIETQKTTEFINDETTEIITQKPTKTATEKFTEIATQKATDKLTELLTEKITEKITEQNIDILTTPITLKITELLTHKIINLETIKNIEKLTEELIYNDKCSSKDIISNKCKEGLIYEDQINDVYTDIKNIYLKGNYTGNNTLNNTIIQTQNVVFQISTLEDQKNSEYEDVSNIDLGACEEKLRSHYEIPDTDSLIIIKVDTKSEDLTQTYVQYQIYDPRDLTSLDLSICNGIQISINTPVVLDNATSNLYDKLKESGYN